MEGWYWKGYSTYQVIRKERKGKERKEKEMKEKEKGWKFRSEERTKGWGGRERKFLILFYSLLFTWWAFFLYIYKVGVFSFLFYFILFLFLFFYLAS